MSLSRLWQQHGKQEEACRLLKEIYGWFAEGLDTPDLQEAKALLEELMWIWDMEWHTPTYIPLFTPSYTNINREWYEITGFKGRGFLYNISLNCKLLQEPLKSNPLT